MKSAGKIHNEATTKRVLDAGFRAVAEYDQHGCLVGHRGTLASQYAWSLVAELAQSRAGIEVEERATAILLGDMLIAVLDLDGGGTLVAIAERPLAEAAALELTKALDSAVENYIGPVPARAVVLAGAFLLAVTLLRSGGASSK